MELKELLALARSRLDRHPVLAAMATRIDARESNEDGVKGTWLSVEFDGPALPEKRTGEVLLLDDGAAALAPLVTMQLDEFLQGCEVNVASAIKRAAR